MLSQRDADNEDHPVAYFSRKLLPREERYSSIEKECLAMESALKHFAVYLVGRRFTIETDHRALRFIHSMTNSNARLTRWAMALQQYSFTVRYRPGKENGNADGLSRQPWGDREDMQPPRMEGGGGGEVLGPASSAPTAESHSLTGGSRLLPYKARLTMIEQATNQNP